MTEYIEREKAFDAVFGQFCASSDETESALNAAIDEIKAIPAADVRPVVRGKWISNNDGETIIKLKYGEPQGSCFCSVCHEWLVASDEYAVKGNFCPNCGAVMEES